MPDAPGQEPLEGMPQPLEATKPRSEDEKILHAELVATAAELHPAEPALDRATRSEQEGGSTDLTEAQRSARAATRAARIAEAQAVLAAGSAKLDEEGAAFAASKLSGPPAKPKLSEHAEPATIKPEHQLDDEAKAQAWIDRNAQQPETD